MPCRPHSSLLTCAEFVLHCRSVVRECMQQGVSGLESRSCDGARTVDIPCCVSSLGQKTHGEEAGSCESLVGWAISSCGPSSKSGPFWRTSFSSLTLSITSHTTWSKLFLLGVLWGGDNRSREPVYRHILEIAFRRRSLGELGSDSGARILMDGTSVGLQFQNIWDGVNFWTGVLDT